MFPFSLQHLKSLFRPAPKPPPRVDPLVMDRPILRQTDTGLYDVGGAGRGTLLTRQQLLQLVFEAAHELKVQNFHCRECSAWAEFKIQWRPQYPADFVCREHLPIDHHDYWFCQAF